MVAVMVSRGTFSDTYNVLHSTVHININTMHSADALSHKDCIHAGKTKRINAGESVGSLIFRLFTLLCQPHKLLSF